MAVLTEKTHAAEFLLSEASGNRSREAITVLSGETLKAGAVLGKITIDPTDVTGAADSGNTGNGTIGTLSAGTGVQAGVYRATTGLKLALRQQIENAGMGKQLANTWRGKFYPNKGLNAAGLVYSKAPHIVSAFNEGVSIRAKGKRFLAIPSKEVRAMNSVRRRRITPKKFPQSLGKLTFIHHRLGEFQRGQ